MAKWPLHGHRKGEVRRVALPAENELLRRRRLERGWSLDEAANRIHQAAFELNEPEPRIDGHSVGRYERGERSPRPRHLKLLCRAYGATPAELGYGPDRVVKRREFVRRAAGVAATGLAFALQPLEIGFEAVKASGADSGVNPVEHLARVRATLVESDNLLGPRNVIPTVERYIDIIQDLRTGRDGTDDRALLQMKAQYAEFAGWLYQDAGNMQAAQHWLDRALEWAHAVADRDLATYVLARKSQLAGDMRDPAAAVDLASAAANLARPRSRLEAVAPTYAAHGHALDGASGACLGALDRARALVARVDDGPETQWASWLDHAYVDVQHARCLSILGAHREAAALFQQAIAVLPPTYRRDRGVYFAREAVAHAGARDPEHAVSIGMHALTIAKETQSWRIVAELHRLSEALAEWRDVPAVGEFRSIVGRRSPKDGR